MPDEPGEPTTGHVDPAERLERNQRVDPAEPAGNPGEHGNTRDHDDPWAARAFLSDVGSAYGTAPAQLREGLELLSRADRVWISPGLPYLVPVFAGLVLGLVYGDLLYAGLRAVGLG